jgi:hypothetical protein
MEPRAYINHFIHQIKKGRSQDQVLTGVFYLLSWLGISLFLAICFSNLIGFAQDFQPYLAVALGPALWILYRYFFRELFSEFPDSSAALRIEKQHPELNNDLLSSLQLQVKLDSPEYDKAISLAFIRQLLAKTQLTLQQWKPEDFLDRSDTLRSTKILIGVAGLWLALVLSAPDYLTQGYANWFRSSGDLADAVFSANQPPSAPIPIPEKVYTIEAMSLRFQFPAYTKKQSQTESPSDGSVTALPGTEVVLTATVSPHVQSAELIVNEEDPYSMQRADGDSFTGSFLVRKKGFYQIQVRDENGHRQLLPQKFSIELEKDRAPYIMLFLSNPQPVYFENDKIKMFYESTDDYGIAQVDLVAHINGEIVRNTIKKLSVPEKEYKDNYLWDLATLDLHSGDEVQYYLEVKDIDNVQGPNLGQSESYRFTVFDSQKERQDIIALQDHLVESLIALLADNLVTGVALNKQVGGPEKWQKLLISNTDHMVESIGIAQTILERSQVIEGFPQSYLNLMANLISGLTELRQEQIRALTDMRQPAYNKPTPISLDDSLHRSLHSRLVSQLERDILFLIKMTNRQKMEQVMDLENQLEELTEALKEEFQNILDKKSPPSPSELKSQLDEIRKTLQKIMDQLAKQTQSRPDEFLNKNAIKHLKMEKLSAALDRISDLAKDGKMEEAMKELEELTRDLQTMSQQLEQARNQMDEMIDQKIMKQLEESFNQIESLEKKQKELLDQTSDINQELRKAQSESFSKEMDTFFEELHQLVEQVQILLKEDKDYLSLHPTIKKLDDLLDEKALTEEKLKSIQQKTLDAELKGNSTEHFKQLRETRHAYSEIEREIDSLRVRSFEQFRKSLPSIQKQYETLEELARLSDLNEFNREFQNIYPEIYRQQSNLRSSRNRKEDIADRLDNDLKEVSRLNSEISKKLGTLGRAMKENFQSRLTPENKSQMEEMAQRQQGMRKDTDDIAKRFAEMNRDNPTIPPELARQMEQTSRDMKQTSDELKEPDVNSSVSSGRKALNGLKKTKEMLEEMQKEGEEPGKKGGRNSPMKLGTGRAKDQKRGGSPRMEKEKVLLPSEDQYKAPQEFREDIMDAMKKFTPQSYERRVMEYYKELVK